MPWSQKEHDEIEPLLPAGFELTYAPDWGWFIQLWGKRNNVTDTFSNKSARAIYEEALKAGKLVLTREDIFMPKGIYLNSQTVERLPGAIEGNRVCPECYKDAGNDYDSPAYVGMTEPPKQGEPHWQEVWECTCGVFFQFSNS